MFIFYVRQTHTTVINPVNIQNYLRWSDSPQLCDMLRISGIKLTEKRICWGESNYEIFHKCAVKIAMMGKNAICN